VLYTSTFYGQSVEFLDFKTWW